MKHIVTKAVTPLLTRLYERALREKAVSGLQACSDLCERRDYYWNLGQKMIAAGNHSLIRHWKMKYPDLKRTYRQGQLPGRVGALSSGKAPINQ